MCSGNQFSAWMGWDQSQADCQVIHATCCGCSLWGALLCAAAASCHWHSVHFSVSCSRWMACLILLLCPGSENGSEFPLIHAEWFQRHRLAATSSWKQNTSLRHMAFFWSHEFWNLTGLYRSRWKIVFSRLAFPFEISSPSLLQPSFNLMLIWDTTEKVVPASEKVFCIKNILMHYFLRV